MENRFKFRVWDKNEKTYKYNHPYNKAGQFYLCENGHLFSDYGNAVSPEIDMDRFIVEQCTGLKDKNGKLIYEGDIYKTYNSERYQVMYINGAFCGGKDKTSYMPLNWSTNEDNMEIIETEDDFLANLEIIGDIHEQKKEVI